MTSFPHTDWHVHYFRDGCANPEMTVGAITSAAAEKGIERIGLLGHYRNRLVIQDLAYWTEPNPRFFTFLKDDVGVARYQRTNYPEIFIGAEVDINTIAGDVSITADEASRLDYIMAGIHWPPTLPPLVDYVDIMDPAALLEAYCSYNKIRNEEFSVERLVGDMFTSMINAISRNPFINIIAHPAGFATRMGPFCVAMDASDYMEKFAAALAANGVAYELNNSSLSEFSPETLEGFVVPLIKSCIKAGVSFVLGSDAHRVKDVGDMARAIALKKKLQIPDAQVVRSPEDFSRKTQNADDSSS